MKKKRENWGSKIGVIFAVAGSAIGLGNFLRFPVKAATNGGGTFLIPYFIALFLIGIPVAWIEWSLGRHGGKYGHGSAPGILNAITRRPWAKYLGSLGIFGPLLIFFYYCYIESWLLGFTWYSLTGELSKATASGQIGTFFGDYIGLKTVIFAGIPSAFFFFIITFLTNFIVIYLGIRRGIELLNEVALPAIFALGLLLLLRTLTLPNIGQGLGYMWNPDLSKLFDSKVWFEAAGQIFFTLSVGIGVILTYASYVRKKQDIALSSLTSCATNEFAEVIVGGYSHNSSGNSNLRRFEYFRSCKDGNLRARLSDNASDLRENKLGKFFSVRLVFPAVFGWNNFLCEHSPARGQLSGR